MNKALYIVSTPIGNLEDITMRALRVLREADLIACEDTRQTRKLLDHYGIAKPAISYHDHNEAARTAELIERLERGENIALVSDAGTPLISDPGYRLVAAAIAAGIAVVPIPGPSAVTGALAAAGLGTDSFRFCGFLPPKSSQRRKTFEELKHESCTLVFYEAPHRILETLEDIAAITGGAVHSRHSGFTLETMDLAQLGRAAQVRVTADRTAIIGGGGQPEAVQFRITQLRA